MSLNIVKPKITYRIDDERIYLTNVKDTNGERVNIALRQMTPEDMNTYESFKQDLATGKISTQESDAQIISAQIIKWADDSGMTSLYYKTLPIETQRLLNEVFAEFCLPSYELVEAGAE